MTYDVKLFYRHLPVNGFKRRERAFCPLSAVCFLAAERRLLSYRKIITNNSEKAGPKRDKAW